MMTITFEMEAPRKCLECPAFDADAKRLKRSCRAMGKGARGLSFREATEDGRPSRCPMAVAATERERVAAARETLCASCRKWTANEDEGACRLCHVRNLTDWLEAAKSGDSDGRPA